MISPLNCASIMVSHSVIHTHLNAEFFNSTVNFKFYVLCELFLWFYYSCKESNKYYEEMAC
jgi:hypothetical protein